MRRLPELRPGSPAFPRFLVARAGPPFSPRGLPTPGSRRSGPESPFPCPRLAAFHPGLPAPPHPGPWIPRPFPGSRHCPLHSVKHPTFWWYCQASRSSWLFPAGPARPSRAPCVPAAARGVSRPGEQCEPALGSPRLLQNWWLARINNQKVPQSNAGSVSRGLGPAPA